MYEKFTGSILFALIGLSTALPCWAGPSVVLGRVTQPGERIAVGSVDHSAWDALLRKYVDAQGRVDYTAWKASADDQRRLLAYLDELSRADLASLGQRNADQFQRDQLAYWLNAYNALTLAGILREYPTSSIRNHTAKLWGYNLWKDLKLQVGDREIAVEQIEHDYLRKLAEPRIHFAIVCASLGCPKLRREAYMPAEVDRQLAENTRDFFADPSKFRYDSGRQVFRVSPILKWFAEDFGDSQAARLKTIADYLPAEAAAAAQSDKIRLEYLDYDWQLNDQKTK